MILAGFANIYDLHRLAQYGATTQGRVTEAESYRAKYGPTYSINYVYTVDGRAYGARQIDLSLSNWSGMGKGQTIPVDYLPESPDISLPSLTDEMTHATDYIWFNLVFPGVIVTIFGAALAAVSILMVKAPRHH